MTVVLDATFLLSFFRPDHAAPPPLAGTDREVPFWRERSAALIEKIDGERSTIVIPAPALSELLVRAGDATADLIKAIEKRSVFRIEAFDVRAAIEVALMTRHALECGDKRDGAQGPWAKVKYDRQIVAIAKVSDASTIYSDDGDVGTIGRRHGMTVIGIADLPIPADSLQGRLDLGDMKLP